MKTRREPVCDLDCLHCAHPDCINNQDIITAQERTASRQRDRIACIDRVDNKTIRRKIYQKAYYEAHREERNAYQRAYREAHREETAAYQKAYYEAHREEIAAYKKAYRKAKKEAAARGPNL